MGRGLFPLLVYWAMIGVAWGRPVDKRVPRVAGGNDPCPAGAGGATGTAAGLRLEREILQPKIRFHSANVLQLWPVLEQKSRHLTPGKKQWAVKYF